MSYHFFYFVVAFSRALKLGAVRWLTERVSGCKRSAVAFLRDSHSLGTQYNVEVLWKGWPVKRENPKIMAFDRLCCVQTYQTEMRTARYANFLPYCLTNFALL